MRKPDFSRLNEKLGESLSVKILTLVNILLYGGWFITYVICTIVRASIFDSAVTQMAARGQTEYVITVSSPVFTVLKVIIGILPVLSILWAVFIRIEDGKKNICDKKIIFAGLGIVLLAAFTAALDASRLGIIF